MLLSLLSLQMFFLTLNTNFSLDLYYYFMYLMMLLQLISILQYNGRLHPTAVKSINMKTQS